MKNFSLESYLSDLKQLCAIDSGHFNRSGSQAVADFFETRYQALGLKTQRLYYKENADAPFLLVSNSEEEDFDVFAEWLFAFAEKRELLGSSSHLLYICRKLGR